MNGVLNILKWKKYHDEWSVKHMKRLKIIIFWMCFFSLWYWQINVAFVKLLAIEDTDLGPKGRRSGHSPGSSLGHLSTCGDVSSSR